MLKTFSANQNTILDLDVACDVAILESSTSDLSIEITASESDLKSFEVYQSGNTVYVKQQNNGNSGGVTIIGNSVIGGNVRQVVTGRGNTVISNVGGSTYISGGSGRVYVNGREINLDDYGGGEAAEPPKITIRTPSINLNTQLKGMASLASKVKLKDAYINVKGSSKVAVIADSLDLNTAGSSEVKAILDGGSLEINVAGSSDVEIEGSYSSASVNLSGTGNIRTRGNCNGNYRVNASGCGRVSHSGRIGGQVRKSISGMATVNV